MSQLRTAVRRRIPDGFRSSSFRACSSFSSDCSAVPVITRRLPQKLPRAQRRRTYPPTFPGTNARVGCPIGPAPGRHRRPRKSSLPRSINLVEAGWRLRIASPNDYRRRCPLKWRHSSMPSSRGVGRTSKLGGMCWRNDPDSTMAPKTGKN